MQLNAEIVTIKSLYFESGSKRLQPGEEYSGMASFRSSIGHISWQYYAAIQSASL